MKIKKIVLSVLQNKLNEMGYIFDKELSLSDFFVFSNSRIGFQTGLYLSKSKWDNTLFPSLRISTSDVKRDLFYIVDGDMALKYSHYTLCEDEEKLIQYLHLILEKFISKGHQWIVDHSIKEFDVVRIYNEIVDLKLKAYSFEKIQMDDDLIHNGKVVYVNGKSQILFQHGKNSSSIFCTFNNLGKQIKIHNIYKLRDDVLYCPPSYTTEEEYISILETYIAKIEEYIS